MKNLIRIGCSLVFLGLSACGSNSTTGTAGANQCAPGYTPSGGGCLPPVTTNPQNCVPPNIWNGATCVSNGSTTGQQIAGQQVAGQMIGQPTIGQTMQTTAIQGQMIPGQMVQTQNCGNGQYFNGISCSVVLVPGNCQSGQINTQSYGCARPASQCTNQYQYPTSNGYSCLPASVILVPSRGSACGSDCYRESAPRVSRSTIRRRIREEDRELVGTVDCTGRRIKKNRHRRDGVLVRKYYRD